MKTIFYVAFEEKDLIERALSITDEESCCYAGPYCPRCRMAIAASRLTCDLSLPYDYGDDMLAILCASVPSNRVWSKEESDQWLRQKLNNEDSQGHCRGSLE